MMNPQCNEATTPIANTPPPNDYFPAACMTWA